MFSSLGKTCREYASRVATGLLSVTVLSATALTLTATSASAARLQAPPGVHLVHAPTSEDYHGRTAAKPDAHLAVALTPSHTVAPGDTLSGIAGTYLGSPTDWRGLCQANAISDCDLIYVGQDVKLTTAVSATAVVHAEPAAPVAPTPPRPVYHAPRPTTPAPVTHTYYVSGGSWQADAQAVFGGQASCADAIIERESGGNVYATNPSSGAYGIPQALPGGKMASAGADWRSDAMTQIRWMRSYVDAVYGGACGAWSFWQVHHSY